MQEIGFYFSIAFIVYVYMGKYMRCYENSQLHTAEFFPMQI